MNAYEKHFKRMTIFENFLKNHPEMVEFVELLELVKNSIENGKNVTVTITQGITHVKPLTPDSFNVILTSKKENPRIFFNYFGNNAGNEPMVLIQDYRGNTSLFSIGLWHTHIISISADDKPDSVNYRVRLTHFDSEYELSFLIKNTERRYPYGEVKRKTN